MKNLKKKKIALLVVFLSITLSSCQLFRLYAAQEDEMTIKKGNLDSEERYRLKQNYPLTLSKINRGEKLTIEDIQNMTKAGVSDDGIIAEIQTSQSIFYLTPKDLEQLRQEGVSERVIQFMSETGEAH